MEKKFLHDTNIVSSADGKSGLKLENLKNAPLLKTDPSGVVVPADVTELVTGAETQTTLKYFYFDEGTNSLKITYTGEDGTDQDKEADLSSLWTPTYEVKSEDGTVEVESQSPTDVIYDLSVKLANLKTADEHTAGEKTIAANTNMENVIQEILNYVNAVKATIDIDNTLNNVALVPETTTLKFTREEGEEEELDLETLTSKFAEDGDKITITSGNKTTAEVAKYSALEAVKNKANENETDIVTLEGRMTTIEEANYISDISYEKQTNGDINNGLTVSSQVSAGATAMGVPVGTIPHKYVKIINLEANTPLTVTHGLNDEDVIVALKEQVDGKYVSVGFEDAVVDTNNITVTSTKAGEYRVIVMS